MSNFGYCRISKKENTYYKYKREKRSEKLCV